MSEFEPRLVAIIPTMRAYARFLTGAQMDADDLVQQALEKAWRARHSYQNGSNLKAWALTILRNTHHNNWRSNRRYVEDPNGRLAGKVQVEEQQAWSAQVRDVGAAIAELDPQQKEALLLIIAGLSYDEAAQSCSVPLRTMQSRVRRARARLADLLADV